MYLAVCLCLWWILARSRVLKISTISSDAAGVRLEDKTLANKCLRPYLSVVCFST